MKPDVHPDLLDQQALGACQHQVQREQPARVVGMLAYSPQQRT
jgi:hypothetical protein